MKRDDTLASGVARSMTPPCASVKACDRPDLLDWASRGGPLPRALAAHVEVCSGCAARVRGVNRLQASFTLLRTRPVPTGLHARANSKALRMLRRAARASEAAGRLLRMKPNLTPWQRAQVHLARMSVGAAAAALVLLMRVGLITGSERTTEVRERLASRYWSERVDPFGDWQGPRDLT